MCFRLSLTASLSLSLSLSLSIFHIYSSSQQGYIMGEKYRGKLGTKLFCLCTWRKAANPSCWPSGKGRHIYSKLNHSPHKCTTSSGRDISALQCKYSKAQCKLDLRHWILQLSLSVQRCSGETGGVDMKHMSLVYSPTVIGFTCLFSQLWSQIRYSFTCFLRLESFLRVTQGVSEHCSMNYKLKAWLFHY